jgi:FkbM family methyltransferase
MSVLRQVVAHPSNAGRRWLTIGRWTIHNIRRRVSPFRVITTRVAGRLVTGPVDHPCVCFAVYVPDGGHEHDAFWALHQLIDPGDLFIDVGANIGLYAVQMDRRLGPSGRILAVEPAPDQVTYLRRNLARLEARTTLVEAAVADAERDAAFEPAGPDLGHLVVSPSASARPVVTTTIDAILGGLDIAPVPAQCVIKIDIEGWEPAALEGAANLLRSGQVKGVLVEARDHQQRSPVRWSSCVDALQAWGYRFVWPDLASGRLHTFDNPPTRSPFGDYVVVSTTGFERLERALRARRQPPIAVR